MSPKTTVLMTPTNVAQVEHMLRTKSSWKLGAAGMAACRRIVREAIESLPQQYAHPWQLSEFRREQTRLERLLSQLGD